MQSKNTIFASLFFLLLTAVIMPQENKIPDYSTSLRSEVPDQYKWKLEDIYKNDQAFENDKKEVETMLTKVDEAKKDWLTSSSKMLAMFKLNDAIQLKLSKLYSYAGHNANSDLSDAKYQAMKGDVQTLYVQAGTKFVFFNDDLLKMDEKVLKSYLEKEAGLSEYKFRIEQILRAKPHTLPYEQEEILSQIGLFSGNFEKISQMMNDVDIPNPQITLSDGKTVELNYSNYALLRGSKNPEDRTNVMKTYWANQLKYQNSLAAVFDGEMNVHSFNAKVRKFKNSLEAKLYGDNIDVNVYFQLIKNVKNNLSPLHRYLDLKKKLLGIDKFKYEDIYASSVKSIDKVYTYDEAKKILLESLSPLGSEYAAGLNKAFNEGWIDVYPNKNKESGAYSSGLYGVHPFVKMNYNGEYDAVSTLTHELGHSMHSYLDYQTQPYVNSGYTIFTAEIASTFNEHLLIDYMIKNEKDDLFKLFLLDNYFEQIRGTIFRQTLFAEFELAMHTRVEEGKALTAEWLNEKYLALTKEYYGHDKGVTFVDDYIKCEWSSIPHFFMNYYVFQYSTGMISSMALSENVLTKKDGALEKYLTMLKSGGNDYPLNLLKKAGVDMTTPQPYERAFERLNKIVTEMENLYTKLKKEGRI